jgi:hypothetical protein
MKSSIMKFFIVVAAVWTLVGCLYIPKYPIYQYYSSVKNVQAIKNSGAKPVSVASFTSYEPDMSSILCRLSFPVISNGASFEYHIQRAFVNELTLADLYDPASPLVLQGKVEELDFNSNIGAGEWIISLYISSNKNSGYKVSTTYKFSTNFVAEIACQQVAQAFVPAVQQLILETVSDPKFKELSQ